jgi:hypothetical protein
VFSMTTQPTTATRTGRKGANFSFFIHGTGGAVSAFIEDDAQTAQLRATLRAATDAYNAAHTRLYFARARLRTYRELRALERARGELPADEYTRKRSDLLSHADKIGAIVPFDTDAATQKRGEKGEDRC